MPSFAKVRRKTNLLFASIPALLALQAATAALEKNPSRAISVMVSAFTSIAICWICSRLRRESIRLGAIAENIADGILFLEKGGISFVNATARKILGHHPNRVWLKAKPSSSLPPAVLVALEKCSQGGSPACYEAFLDGIRRNFSISSIFQNGKEQAYLFQDITFLRENEEAKAAFISTLSHEIKTPITSLALSLAMLERIGLDAELVRIANTDVTRLKALLEDLLSASRIKVVRHPRLSRKQDVNLGFLAQQALQSAEGLAEQKEVRLKVSPWPRERVIADVDPARIGWAMSALLSDSIRQSPQGCEIDVSLEFKGGHATFTIDYGRPQGFPDRAKHALVRDIIESHAGRFAALSKTGNRNTFSFSILARAVEAKASSQRN